MLNRGGPRPTPYTPPGGVIPAAQAPSVIMIATTPHTTGSKTCLHTLQSRCGKYWDFPCPELREASRSDNFRWCLYSKFWKWKRILLRPYHVGRQSRATLFQWKKKGNVRCKTCTKSGREWPCFPSPKTLVTTESLGSLLPYQPAHNTPCTKLCIGIRTFTWIDRIAVTSGSPFLWPLGLGIWFTQSLFSNEMVPIEASTTHPDVHRVSNEFAPWLRKSAGNIACLMKHLILRFLRKSGGGNIPCLIRRKTFDIQK